MRLSLSILAACLLIVSHVSAQEEFNVPLRICMGGVATEDSFGRLWLGGGPGPGDPLNIRPDDRGGANWIENWEIGRFQPDSLAALGFDPDHPGDKYIFNTIRWDEGGPAPDFLLEIPIANGTYTVNMYFTEGCCMNRHFKIEIQGDLVDDDVSYLDYDPANPALGRTGRLSFDRITVNEKVLRIGLLPCPECPGGGDINAIVDALEVVSGPECDHRGLDFNCSWNPQTGEVAGIWNPLANAEGYRLLKNGQLLQDILPGSPTSFIDPSPSAGGLIPSYVVQALRGGATIAECRSTVKAYACPEGLSCAVDQALGKVALSWTGGTSAAGVTGYEVRRNRQLLKTLPPDATSFDDEPTERSNQYEVTPVGNGPCVPMSCTASVEKLPFSLPLRLNMGGAETVDSKGNVWLGDGPGAGDPLNIRPDDRSGTNWIENWSIGVFQPDSLEALGFDPTHPGDLYIFNTIRWDVGGDAFNFILEIPIPNGECLVNMYFTEGCCPGRHFQIEIQGQIVDDDVSYLDYDPVNPSLGRTGRLAFERILVEDGILRVGFLPCPDPKCPGSTDTNAIINAIEAISTGPLPVRVLRDLSKDTFGLDEVIEVSLGINVQGPGGAITVQEQLPEAISISAVSDAGVLAGNTITWDLTVAGEKTLRYKLAPTPCAGDLPLKQSTWKMGTLQGKVTGETLLKRAPLAEKDLGPWESVDVGAASGAAEPLGDHDMLVHAKGGGIKLTKDEFRFVHTPAAGDFEISAAIDCLDDPAGSGQGGLMVRDTLDVSSAHAFFSLSSTEPAGGGVGTLKGISRRETAANRSSTVIAISQKDVTALPVYLKLKRTGAKISFQRSADGVAYTEVATKDIGPDANQIKLRNETLVGLAVTGGGAGSIGITFRGVSGPAFKEVGGTFRRGDADANGILELTDAIKLLNYLFVGGEKPECLDAADTDDSGVTDISDAIGNLQYQFLGGTPPVAPGPTDCGADPNAEDPDLGCDKPCA